MKKILIISFLVFTILTSLLCTSYAAVTITEESLENSFKKFAKGDGNENSEISYSMKIDKENKKITITADDEDYIMDYDLSGKPTFKIAISFNNEMSKEEWEKEGAKSTIPTIMFELISDIIAGIEFKDSMAYISSAMFKDGQFIVSTDDSNTAVEYAKSRYDNINETLVNNLFTWTNKKISETEDTYIVESTLVINNDADFSTIDGYFEQLGNTIQNSMQNIVNGIQQATNNAELSLNNLITQQESVNKVTSSINKLPQTGASFGLKDGLYILCIVSSIALLYIILKSIKYRNINKK